MKKVFFVRCKSSNSSKISQMIVVADSKEQALEIGSRPYRKQDIVRLNAHEIDLNTSENCILLNRYI